MIGIDPGGKRLGIAVGDGATAVASPVQVIAYGGIRQAARHIADAVARHRADGVIVGLPTNADGDETSACARSHALVAALGELGIAARLQSEFLSSNEAGRRARTAGRRRDEPVDDLAACVILEDFFAAAAGGEA